jgi:hypothetical protein
MPRKRPRHLTHGWCWEATDNEDPRIFGIYGHFDVGTAVEIVSAYTDEEFKGTAYRTWGRMVPCRRDTCPCDGGSHMEEASGPGRGASPITWVTEQE